MRRCSSSRSSSRSHVWDEAPALMPQLRARFPAAPVVLRVPRGTDEAELEWARRAGRLQVRAVVVEGEVPRTRLRQVLTDVPTFPEQVEQWLPLRLPGLAPEVGRMIATIVRLAPRYAEVSVLLGTLGHAERTVRTWFRRAGVPGPGKWLAAAHAVHAALRLQGGGVVAAAHHRGRVRLQRPLVAQPAEPPALRRPAGHDPPDARVGVAGRPVAAGGGRGGRRSDGRTVGRSVLSEEDLCREQFTCCRLPPDRLTA